MLIKQISTLSTDALLQYQIIMYFKLLIGFSIKTNTEPVFNVNFIYYDHLKGIRIRFAH